MPADGAKLKVNKRRVVRMASSTSARKCKSCSYLVQMLTTDLSEKHTHSATEEVLNRSPALSFDILFIVMSMLSLMWRKHDLYAVTRTCRTLYAAGVRMMLQPSHGLSVKEGEVVPFCKFVLFNQPSSFTALRQLSLQICRFYGNVKDPADIELVVEMLKGTRELRTLSLEQGVLSLDPRLSGIIASYTNLTSLDLIHEGDVPAKATLENLQSQLVEVNATFTDHAFDPIPMLANSCDTLRDAAFNAVDFRNTEICYPHVTTLYANSCNRPRLAAMIAAFPNVRELHIDTTACDDNPATQLLRQENVAAQTRQAWKPLDIVYADLAALYLMGLQCRVNHLYLEPYMYFDDTDETLRWLHAALAPIRPRRLFLHVWTYAFDIGRLPLALSVGTQDMDRLDLVIDITIDQVHPDIVMVRQLILGRRLVSR